MVPILNYLHGSSSESSTSRCSFDLSGSLYSSLALEFESRTLFKGPTEIFQAEFARFTNQFETNGLVFRFDNEYSGKLLDFPVDIRLLPSC